MISGLGVLDGVFSIVSLSIFVNDSLIDFFHSSRGLR